MKKIVVIGPESTGKSTLCKDLATCFQIKTVPEYARVYLESNGVESGAVLQRPAHFQAVHRVARSL